MMADETRKTEQFENIISNCNPIIDKHIATG